MMNFQPNICFGGYNPFMMVGYNPRMNFFLGMASASINFGATYMPFIPTPTCSVFNPNFQLNYTNPFCFGNNNFNVPVFNYNMPTFNSFSYSPSGSVSTPSQTLSEPVQTVHTVTDKSDDEIRPQGMTLKGKGKGTQYGPAFLNKVKQIAKNINCNYRDLLAIMNSESGIDARTVGYNGASGLICFMPQYFDVKKIRKMSPMEQLDEVEKLIKSSKKIAGFADNAKLSKGDLYALVFLPARAKQDVLCQKNERGKDGRLLRFYESNAALDYNNDKKITKDEMARRIDKKYVSDSTFLA